MPNRNYEKGRRFEYELADELREQGYDTCRTSGSHGKFDVIGIHPETGNIILIQAKVTEEESEANRLIKAFRASPPYRPLTLPKGVHQRISVKVSRKGRREAIL